MVPMLTQLGYVLGLLLVTPLGDVLERRNLLSWLLAFAGLALLAGCLAPAFAVFAAASFAIGMTSVLVQIIIPLVATLSRPEERARSLGIILSAALIGILISRTIAGFLGAYLGWRGMYGIGSALMIALALTLFFTLPKSPATPSTGKMKYFALLRSVGELHRKLPTLRAVSVTGALMYAALSAFWASLAFYLQSDTFHLGADTAGAFGLVGAMGALAANAAGRLANRVGARRIVQGCILIMGLAYGVMAFLGWNLPGLIAGVLLLDVGAQAATVSNQSEIYKLHSEGQTRMNTIYKMYYFVGGAIGSATSTTVWHFFGWKGVCGAGFAFLTAAWMWEFYSSRFGFLEKATRVD
jgi:predicted MFS family arabinose efflux permease